MFQQFLNRPAARAESPLAPPPPRRSPSDLRIGVGRWLARSWPFGANDTDTLTAAQQAFVDTLDGIPAVTCGDLPRRLMQARSLLELWHLRPELYSLVSRHLDQAEAQQRVGELARHFPAGTVRSGFGALAARQR